MDDIDTKNDCVVWKLGGSILRRSADYDRCAGQIAAAIERDTGSRIVVVVSARFGVTNRLVRQATRILGDRSTPEVDLLLATGELQSVAQLSMRLRRLDVSCVGLTPEAIGLHIDAGYGNGFRVDGAIVRRAFKGHRVIVVPGFVGVRADGAWATLGRGGSDLTAVALAAALDARRCELIKDVPGYFTSDPNVDRSATHLARVSYATALSMAESGCDLVQTEALRHAEQCRVDLILRTLDGDPRSTVVGASVDVDRASCADYPASRDPDRALVA